MTVKYNCIFLWNLYTSPIEGEKKSEINIVFFFFFNITSQLQEPKSAVSSWGSANVKPRCCRLRCTRTPRFPKNSRPWCWCSVAAGCAPWTGPACPRRPGTAESCRPWGRWSWDCVRVEARRSSWSSWFWISCSGTKFWPGDEGGGETFVLFGITPGVLRQDWFPPPPPKNRNEIS